MCTAGGFFLSKSEKIFIMTDSQKNYLKSLVNELRKLPQETEWVEFKQKNDDPEMIGHWAA